MVDEKLARWAGLLLLCSDVVFAAESGVPARQGPIDGAGDPLQEVVVTAEKRSTDLQKTSLLVNVVSGDEMREQSVTNTQSLQTVIPNLFVTRAGPRNDFAIRGVSAQIVTNADQPSTAFLVDGIYTLSPTLGLGSFLDVAQIEVLKGPQGTLFGRNATAGAINIISQRPRFDREMELDLDAGNHSKLDATAVLNVPLSEQLAVRMAAQQTSHDGYYRDGFDDELIRASRVSVLWQPTDNLSWLLRGYYAWQGGKGAGLTFEKASDGRTYTADPWAGPTDPVNQARVPAFRGLYGYGSRYNNETLGANTQLDWSFGGATLTGVLSYQDADRDDIQQNFQTTYVVAKDKSAELRVASNEAARRLKWLAGLYWYEQAESTENFGAQTGLTSIATPPFAVDAHWDQVNVASFTSVNLTHHFLLDNKAYAGFSQESFAVTDTFRVIAGGRWQHEEAARRAALNTRYTTVIVNNNPVTTAASSNNLGVDGEWNVFTWKAGTEWDVAPDSMAYFNVSTGWKAGKANQYLPPYQEQKPEKLLAYTLGIKNRFLQQHLQLNGEIFYWDYRDRQIQYLVNPVYDSNGVPQVTVTGAPGALVPSNAPKSHIDGADLDMAYRFTVADLLSVSVEYLAQAIYDDLGRQSIPSCPQGKDCQANDAPRFSGTLSYRHTFDLQSHGELTLDLSSKVQSSVILTLSAAVGPGTTQAGYSMSNVGLSFRPRGSRWSVRAYVNNIEDRVVRSNVTIPSITSPYYMVAYMPPRTLGIQLHGEIL